MIAIGVLALLFVYLLMVTIPLKKQSKPVMTEEVALKMIDDLKSAFEAESTEQVVSFAADDAVVAGKDLSQIRDMLHQAFRLMKKPKVEFINTRFDTEGKEKAHVTSDVSVSDLESGGTPEKKFSGQMGFSLERRPEQHLFGLVNVYRWKIVKVESSTPMPTGL